jgi:hypothetical protein
MTIDGKQVVTAQVDTTAASNRANEIAIENSNFVDIKVGLYNIDETLVNYLNDRIKPTVTQNGTQIVVPVLYANPERWAAVQQNGVLRDKQGKLQLPLILMNRTMMSRNKMNNPMNRYHHQTLVTGWNRRNAYDRFTTQNGIKPSQELINVVIPDYYVLNYEVILWTEFISQLNELVEQISFETEDYWGERNKYKFLVEVQDYKTTTEFISNADRMVKCTFNMNVSAYLLPERILDTQRHPTSTTKLGFTVKKIVFKEEIVTKL